MNDPLLAFLAGGKDPSHVSGLNDEFARRLAVFAGAAPGGITINSGFRSVERQQQLWDAALAKYGSPEAARKWVAPPGKSNHNHGLAADLGYASPEVEAWAHENAAKYGLNFRMGHEPWHIEMLPDGSPVAVPDNAGGGVGGMASAAAAGAPPRPGLVPIDPSSPAALAEVFMGRSGQSPRFQAAPPTPKPQEAPANIVGADPNQLAYLLDEVQAAYNRPKQSGSLASLLKG